MTSYALIANPASGSGQALRKAEELGELLSGSSSVEVLQTTHRGSAIELAEEAAGRVDRVMAVGGDGTLNEVLNGLMKARTTVSALPELGFFPAGTANAATQAFRLSSKSKSVAQALRNAESRPLDVGLVEHEGGERAFLLWFGAGWDGVVIHVLNEERSGHMGVSGLFGHIPQIIRAIARYPQPPIRATVDAGSFGEHSTVVVANVPAIGFGGMVAEMADPSDGHFDVVGVPNLSIPRFLRVGARMMVSSLTRAKGIRRQTGTEVLLESQDRVPFHLDGEAVGLLPARARLLPGAVRFLRT